MGASKYFLVLAALCLLECTAFYAVPLEDTEVTDEGEDASSRILNGNVASAMNYRYQAAILENKRHACIGSIINDRFVITAATCVTTSSGALKSTKNFQVGVGYTDLNVYNDTIAYRVSRFYVHEEFNSTTLQRNIALVRIRDYFEYESTVFPIQLGSYMYSQYNIRCLTIGYGQIWTSPAAPNMQQLYYGAMYVSECGNVTPRPPSNTVCATSHTERFGLCEGDIGAPLVCVSELVGVASHSDCSVNGTAVYTSVPAHTTWIKDVIEKDSASPVVASGVLTALLAVLTLVRGSV